MAFGRALLDFGTGVREIDAGHEGLAFLMARIFEPGVECGRKSGACGEHSCNKLSALLTFLRHNFAAESDLMERGGYPNRDAHCDDHVKVVEDLKALQASRVCAERDRVLVRQVVDRWALRHFQACDHPLGRWAVTRRVVPAA